MPQMPFGALQPLEKSGFRFFVFFGSRGYAFGELGQPRESHRYMKPVKNVFSELTEADLSLANGVAPIGEKRDRVVRFDPLFR